MIFNDTTDRTGAIQECERLCGLGATGITSNTTVFQDFTSWLNKWNKIAIKQAILAQNGFDIDDPNWTTYPSGTYVGTTNRDYVFSSTEQLLKIKKVGITTDGTNYVEALPIDSNDPDYLGIKAGNVEPRVLNTPRYDPTANGLNLYPKFTAAEVSAGAKVYVEFYREPKVFATTGTDNYIVQFEDLVTKGASYEYACLYKPDLASSLRSDIYGNGANIKGIIKDMEEWYSQRYPRRTKITAAPRNYE